MKKSLKSKIIVTSLIFVYTANSTAFAGEWVDDWLSSKTASGPSSFEGSKRNYYSAGSLSARWPTSNDHLFNISKPTLRSGCGGIDLFLGGFNFLNVEYLVEKLQRIMAAAPAAAFDIALKTLAPQVSETIGKLEAIIDRLNNLQIDDCKAAKTMVAQLATGAEGVGNYKKGDAAASLSEFMSSSGVGELWKSTKDVFSAEQKGTAASTTQKDSSNAATAGCSAEVRAIFGDGSVIQNAGNQKGLPNEYIDLIRGLLGDVIVVAPNTTGTSYHTAYITPCGENTGDVLEALQSGKAYSKAPNATACTPPSAGTNINLRLWASNMLNSIAIKMKTKSALTTQEEAFLTGTPMSVSLILRGAIATKTETSAIPQLAELVSKGYAYYNLIDLYGKVGQMIAMAKQMVSTKGHTTSTTDAHTCDITLLKDSIETFFRYEEKIYQAAQGLQQSYTAAIEENQALANYMATVEHHDNQWRSRLTQAFGENNKAPAFMRRTGLL